MLKQRLAISTYFFVAGIIHASWFARQTEVQMLYGLSNAQLGSLLLLLAAGALTAMPFAGVVAVKLGSRRLLQWAGPIYCLSIACVPLLRDFWAIGSLFLLIGMLGGAIDVTMNGQAVSLENHLKKPIMSSFHAVFSGGMFLGAALGAFIAKSGLDLASHLTLMALFCIGIELWAMRHLMVEAVEATPPTSQRFQLPTRAILPIGLIAFCGMTGEGAMADWSAIYLHKIALQDETFAPLGLSAFASAMFIGRLFGDYLTLRLGRRRLLLLSSGAAIIGLGMAIFIIQPYVILFGFALVGLGLATIVPIVYAMAGNTEGVAPSVGIAMATSIGYAGFFVGPPVIGYLGDAYSLRWGLGFAWVLFLILGYLIYKQKR